MTPSLTRRRKGSAIAGRTRKASSTVPRGVPRSAYTFRYTVPASSMVSMTQHMLSKKGPFIDAHLGPLTPATPIGQTFYIRPITTYNAAKKSLYISLQSCSHTTHFNNNTITDKLQVKGTIRIAPFEWDAKGVARKFPNQKLYVNVKVKNGTGLPLQGLHIHDGQLKGGLVGFGPICYFLGTSQAWLDKYNTGNAAWIKKHGPLPMANLVMAEPRVIL